MATASIRPAAVAGQFYVADERILRAQLTELLAAASPQARIAAPPKAIIAPHAGYLYSGPIAASAYDAVAPLAGQVRRVVLLGPAHRMAVAGFALPAAQIFMTPLGAVPVSRTDWQTLQNRDDVCVDDRPHALEHALEVQLPFLQTIFDSFEIVPVLVGDAAPQAVADVLASLWGGPETLIVVSSDLSHYLPYRQAQWSDRTAIEQIIELRPTLTGEQACGAAAINGLLLYAQRQPLIPQVLDLRNSGDTAGGRNSVVGYASIAFFEAEPNAHARH